MKKFGISRPQASADFSTVLARLPNLMQYDRSIKAYVLKEKFS